MADTEKLEALACPFCGSRNVSDGENLIESEAHGVGRVVCKQSECMNCGACGPLSKPVDGADYGDVAAIAAWNRRTPPQPIAGGEAVAFSLPEPWGYARSVDGKIEMSVGPTRPADRAGGYATPWAPMFCGAALRKHFVGPSVIKLANLMARLNESDPDTVTHPSPPPAGDSAAPNHSAARDETGQAQHAVERLLESFSDEVLDTLWKNGGNHSEAYKVAAEWRNRRLLEVATTTRGES